MNIRMVVADVDGTLLNRSRGISPRTKAILQFIGQEQRVPVILASSRMPKAMRYFLEELGFDFPLIAYNGGLVQDDLIHKTSSLLSETIPFSIFAAVAGVCAQSGMHISIYRNDEWFAAEEDKWVEREQRNTKTSPTILDIPTIVDMWQYKQMGPHKLMIMGDSEDLTIVQKLLHQHHQNQLSIYRSKDTYLEISAGNADKSVALRFLCSHFGVKPSEVVAFGDNWNDIEMIKFAGKGIAVKNAIPELKEVADEITSQNDQDGVAKSLEKLFY